MPGRNKSTLFGVRGMQADIVTEGCLRLGKIWHKTKTLGILSNAHKTTKTLKKPLLGCATRLGTEKHGRNRTERPVRRYIGVKKKCMILRRHAT